MIQYTYINGRYVSARNAVVSVQDRGFRYGDGLFETIAVYGGIPYQWELHMERLEAGLKTLEIPAGIDDLYSVALKLLSRNRLTEASIRIAVSRGLGSRGYLPIGAASPTIVVEAMPCETAPIDPARLWLSEIEKPSPRTLPVEHKLAQGLNSTLVRMEAARHGCLDGLQLNASGHIAETSSGNLFWRKENILYTPHLSCGILPGTTRAAFIRLATYKIVEGMFTLQDLQGVDALVATNTNWQAMPIGELAPENIVFEHSVGLASELRALLKKDIAQYAALRKA